MFDPSATIATLYVCAPPDLAATWLAQGIPAAMTPDEPHARLGAVSAWLTPDPRRAEASSQWLTASLETARIRVADWDLAQGAASSADRGAARRLLSAYNRTVTPWHEYRLGMFRRPEALVWGGIPADRLARLTPIASAVEHETTYAQQIIRALRAMLGAPLDAPFHALVAAAVARRRAQLVAAFQDKGRIYLYGVDNDSWYFTLDTAFNHLTALPYADSPRIKG